MPPQRQKKPSLHPSTRPAKPPPNIGSASIHTLEAPIPSSPDPTTLGLDRDIPEVIHSLPYEGKKSARTLLARGLPPMSDLGDMYKDMTGRAMELGFGRVLEHLGERKLRVVTVCSGTESPVLALEMVQRSEFTLLGEMWINADFE